MDGKAAFENNREALKRFLAMLIAMAEMGFAELGTGGQFPFFRQKSAGGAEIARAEKRKLSPALPPLTLPRHLYRAILKLLRPAESAVRRLIVVAARGLVVTLPPLRQRKPKKPRRRRARGAGMSAENRHVPALPLLDPLKPWKTRPWRPAPTSVPRILSLDAYTPFQPLPPPPSRDDPIDAVRLAQRLQALTSALDDLPGQAKRFARWKARREATVKEPTARRCQRLSPLRPGRPPGGRLSRYDPTATHPRSIREIDEILAHTHALAVYALETPDTS
ncbi:hypothetical protein [Mesorhizobium sp. CN2-181]|uniref:hypothetical protein n=1 Tax=Mesorhizobium yinganensis TaxID=3157707 RepID=UPI0032B73C31